MSSTYNIRKCHIAPTHFLVNTRLSTSLNKSKLFDHLIKAEIPTLGCLLQSIDGSLKLAYLVSILRINKTLWLYHIQIFFNVAIEEHSFDIHLPYLIAAIANIILTDFSIATGENASS